MSGSDGVETVPFERYHGTGNDFLVVRADADVPDRAAFAAAHCDRESGVRAGDDGRRGADGVLFLALDADATPPRATMTLVQPDGSIAEMCGNGARCAAAWTARECGATGTTTVVLDTPAGDRRATVADPGGAAADPAVEVEMGRPSFDPADVPLRDDADGLLVEREVEGLTVTAVNTGVPHAVAFVESVDAVDLDSVAPPVRYADAFPEGANVTLASAASGAAEGDADTAAFRQRTYERGVEGETRACGTGAVAVAAAARRLGLTDRESFRVSPPGGTLEVTAPDDGPATLAGPATREFAGELEADP